MDEQHLLSVCSCNRSFSEKTLHPLISVIDLSKDCKETQLYTDSYAIIFRHFSLEDYSFGRTKYDFSNSTLIFREPGKRINISSKIGEKSDKDNLQDTEHSYTIDIKDSQPKDLLLIFNPHLLYGTVLSQKIKEYSFFHYKPEEALHLSKEETKHIYQMMNDIQKELEWGIDRFTATIISNKIEMLLNYCCRYYDRQFITRHDAKDQLADKIRISIDKFLLSGKYEPCNVPSACRFAVHLNISSSYLNDLLKHETGKDFNDYLQLRRIEISKQMLLTNKTDHEIASLLGYCTTKYFRQIFQKSTGCTTEEYRRA